MFHNRSLQGDSTALRRIRLINEPKARHDRGLFCVLASTCPPLLRASVNVWPGRTAGSPANPFHYAALGFASVASAPQCAPATPLTTSEAQASVWPSEEALQTRFRVRVSPWPAGLNDCNRQVIGYRIDLHCSWRPARRCHRPRFPSEQVRDSSFRFTSCRYVFFNRPAAWTRCQIPNSSPVYDCRIQPVTGFATRRGGQTPRHFSRTFRSRFPPHRDVFEGTGPTPGGLRHCGQPRSLTGTNAASSLRRFWRPMPWPGDPADARLETAARGKADNPSSMRRSRTGPAWL